MSTTSPNPYLSNIVDHVVKCESLGSLSFVLKESALKLAAVLNCSFATGCNAAEPDLAAKLTRFGERGWSGRAL